MSYRIEGEDIVIDGWENGISNNPYKGINDMRGFNIVSIPGEASLSFAQTNKTFSSCAGTVTSADAGTDIITATITTGALPDDFGMAITFTGASLPTGITAGTIYWLLKDTSNTFKIYSNFAGNNIVDITTTGTGTFSSINIGEITYFEKLSNFALDKNGRCWFQRSNGFYSFTGNDVTSTLGLQNTVGNGLIWYKGYLFLFYNSRICYTAYTLGTAYNSTWVNEWNPVTGAVSVGTSVFNTATGTPNPHEAVVGINDDTVYITDDNYIASLFENAGSTFDPTNTATYSWAKQAIASPLPSGDKAQCIAELGNDLLIGGQYNAIYPWNRIDSGPSNAILISENDIKHMITVNTNTYIFAGKRGRIYVTNGSQAQQYAKIPDHISSVEPIFTWYNCAYNKNQIYFGVSATDNSGSTLQNYSGLWAIDITTNSLRVATLQSTSNATVTAVYAFTGGVSGYGLSVGWKTASTYGIDNSSSTPYTSYVAYVNTDIIPVGTLLYKRTLNNLELKLSAPLANGEGIRISYRINISDSFTVIGETLGTSSYNPISDVYPLNFDQSQWLQLKVETKSTALGGVTPSYVRLYELRIR